MRVNVQPEYIEKSKEDQDKFWPEFTLPPINLWNAYQLNATQQPNQQEHYDDSYVN